jgi:2-(1,2-epoxy-1,2-dihydrophenyl)acetyl-CoA isomerase
MGVARARRFVLMGEVLDSQAALQTGLIDRVVPDAELQAQALSLAQELAQGPTLAYGEIKRLFLRASSAQLESQLEDEAMTLGRVSVSADAQEGIAAQMERRKPVFRGC